jgi:hypothetical protein
MGIWIDENDAPRFSVPELLDHFGWPHDDEHIALSVRRARLARKTGRDGQEKCPTCGPGAERGPRAGLPADSLFIRHS